MFLTTCLAVILRELNSLFTNYYMVNRLCMQAKKNSDSTLFATNASI